MTKILCIDGRFMLCGRTLLLASVSLGQNSIMHSDAFDCVASDKAKQVAE